MADPKSFILSEAIHDYVVSHSSQIGDVRLRLIEETATLGPVAAMQVAPEQSVFLTILTRALGVRRAVEVGTFTGMSALSIALGMAPDGELLCCDVSEKWTAIARRYWAEAGVTDRIDLRIAPAAETLAALPAEERIDLAFIDADKPGYISYWDALVPRIRPGGVLLVDNVLWGGRVVDGDSADDTVAIKAFNDHCAADDRVDLVVLPIADGLTMACRK